MYNFVIDTNDFLYDDDAVYCDSCNSCGVLGCECWGNCIALRCKYGDTLIDQYEDNRKDCSLFYDMLVALGIENAFAIDLDRVKKIAGSQIEFRGFSLRDLIKDEFDQFKDVEE